MHTLNGGLTLGTPSGDNPETNHRSSLELSPITGALWSPHLEIVNRMAGSQEGMGVGLVSQHGQTCISERCHALEAGDGDGCRHCAPELRTGE